MQFAAAVSPQKTAAEIDFCHGPVFPRRINDARLNGSRYCSLSRVPAAREWLDTFRRWSQGGSEPAPYQGEGLFGQEVESKRQSPPAARGDRTIGPTVFHNMTLTAWI